MEVRTAGAVDRRNGWNLRQPPLLPPPLPPNRPAQITNRRPSRCRPAMARDTVSVITVSGHRDREPEHSLRRRVTDTTTSRCKPLLVCTPSPSPSPGRAGRSPPPAAVSPGVQTTPRDRHSSTQHIYLTRHRSTSTSTRTYRIRQRYDQQRRRQQQQQQLSKRRPGPHSEPPHLTPQPERKPKPAGSEQQSARHRIVHRQHSIKHRAV